MQKHPGNIMYRKLVHINKIIYAKCCRADKIKISKGIVDAVRELGGRFLLLDDNTGMYNDIGDQKAKEKTSQALREGQTSIRKRLLQNGEMPTPSHQKEISAQGYFGYSVQVLDSLWRDDENTEAIEGGMPSPPTLPAEADAVQSQQHTSMASIPAPVPSTSTIESSSFCSSELNASVMAMCLDQFPALVQSARNAMHPITFKSYSVRGGRPEMQRAGGNRSFEGSEMASAMPTEIPPLPPVIDTRANSDDSRPSIRLTNMSLASTSSVAHILEFLCTSKEIKTADDIRGTIESVFGEIDELSRMSEQRMTQINNMTSLQMSEAIRHEDAQVALKGMIEGSDHSGHSDKEVFLSDEGNMMERMSDLRFSSEDDFDKLRFTGSESSRVTNYSKTSLMGASILTFGMDDMTKRRTDATHTAAL